jgi:hypothetical protein
VRRALATAALAVTLPGAALAAAPSPARAADPYKCDADMRWCVGAFIKHGRRFLDIGIMDRTGRYRVCVTPPRGRERCKSFTLVKIATGAGSSSVAFTNHFPHARRGRYAARWIFGGKQVGPVIRFKHPS